MAQQRPWIREQLPNGASRIPESTHREVLDRFNDLVECRDAPIAGSARSELYSFFWPKSPLLGRAIPGGIASLDAEEGYSYDLYLDLFFNDSARKEVLFWAVGLEKIGIFKGAYNEELRWWIKRNIIASPTVLICDSSDVLMISDEQWRFSVVGGDVRNIHALEAAFGGPERLQSSFLDWVNGNGVGFGDEGKRWAYKYPIPWSGWS